MLQRATELLGHSVGNITGGTFHAFAYSVLRQNPPAEYQGSLSIMDSADANGALKYCKDMLAVGKGDKSFPKIQTVMGMLSKSRNKEMELHDILRREAFHLAAYRDDIANIGSEYEQYKSQHGLLDYDDLLFKLEQLLTVNKEVREYYQKRFKYIMVDEYQDTNLVQARIVRLLAGGHGNVMAVGDDAQSIYAFRGANVQNILDFPKLFKGCNMVKLEENYRSIQPILDLTNAILADAPQAFQKNLFSNKKDGRKPEVLIPLSDLTQAKMVVDKIGKLRKKYKNKEIAVLFRAGYQS
jgi:DNA helicase-2/ATP-dependent DNA helicase PcrA